MSSETKSVCCTDSMVCCLYSYAFLRRNVLWSQVFWPSYGNFSQKRSHLALKWLFKVFLLFFFYKFAITWRKLVQIPKFWFLNLTTIICPSYDDIHSTNMVIEGCFSGVAIFKTLKNMPNFSILNPTKWNISSEAPWTDLKSHIPEKPLAICFRWCMTLVRTQKFLLSSFLGGVVGKFCLV